MLGVPGEEEAVDLEFVGGGRSGAVGALGLPLVVDARGDDGGFVGEFCGEVGGCGDGGVLEIVVVKVNAVGVAGVLLFHGAQAEEDAGVGVVGSPLGPGGELVGEEGEGLRFGGG